MTIEPISSVMTMQAQNTAAARNTVTKVTTEENPSEYNPANVKAADKIDQTTSVVENAKGKEQNNTSSNQSNDQQQQITNEQIKKAVKELPPEKTLDMIAKVWEMAGILVDEKR